ncbi:MAG TPA: hypothetical protein GXZ98_10735 [Firmicutes bacterium]|jgi:hypothetical protein|nr:hypothetical protein [Bacillota bacterium]
MVKRWRGYGKLMIKVPWPFGAKVHRIDLTINDLVVKWETGRVHLKVDLEREILFIAETGRLERTVDRISYERKLTIPPGLIRGQPLAVKATSRYLTVQYQEATAYLEQGIGLTFFGWERRPLSPDWPTGEQSIPICGRILVAQDSYLHTEPLSWPELSRDDPPVKKTLTKVVFSLTPQGIHCQGELQLIFVHRPKIIRPLSVLIPQKVPVGAIVTGQAELADLKIIGVKKALLLVKLDWRLFEEKLLLVKGAPVKEGEAFFLQRLQGQKAEKWGGTFHLKLPEKAKLIEEVTVIGVQGWTVKDEKGLLCMGRIDLELLYINHQDQEKAYRLQIPWEEWFAAAHFQETVDRHSETVSHHLKVEEVKTELIRFTNGDELTLFLHLAYLVRVTQRQKVSLPLPLHPRRTATILAKKIISEEKIEYYVEIPLTTPADFSENHRLWWRRGSERGDTVNGGVIIRTQPTIIWQYRNRDHQSKVVELKPVLSWFHSSPEVCRGQQACVKTEAIGLQLQKDNQGSFSIQLLLSGWLVVTTEEVRRVELGGQPDYGERPILPPKKKAVLKWEEKLPSAVRQILTAHFFLGEFRRIKTAELFLLEGEVKGEITYLAKDGVYRHYRLQKELWASLPPEYSRVPVLIPILTGWNCSPLPVWKWEKGGVWCEIALELLAFTSHSN